jgi:phospholipid/cholesterol/gamma-HCH transport system substrate-binding protein
MNSLLFKIKKNFLASLVLLIIVVSCGLAAYFFHPASPYFKRYTFVVKYETIGTLSPGNLVRVRGIAKGEIVSVELTDEAVYVRARVLADTKIPVNSEFRLVTAGLMGEREMSVITGNSDRLVTEGDTVRGLYDEGTSGISKNLSAIFKDIDDLKLALSFFTDSLMEGDTGKRMERVAKKAKKIVRITKSDVRQWKSLVDELLEGFQVAGDNAKNAFQQISDRGGESAAKADELFDRVRALMDRANALADSCNAVVTNFDESEGSVNLFRDESSRINREFDKLKKDFESMIEGVKKDGLKLNVDIF